jgi:cell division protease FtsH
MRVVYGAGGANLRAGVSYHSDMTPLPTAVYHADFHTLVRAAADAAGLADPLAVELDEFETALLESATAGPIRPIDGVLVRRWEVNRGKTSCPVQYGCRAYRLDGVPFARVWAALPLDRMTWGYNFAVVGRADYPRLYRLAVKLHRAKSANPVEPVMDAAQRRALWQNTIRFLEPANLQRVKEYGGRAKRGLLLTGPPGNGKTSACRWVKAEVERRGWQAKSVTPDDYQAARRDGCNPAKAVKELFQANGRGVVFFDDLDIAIRDRDTVKETDDQAVFLSALDGIDVTEGVVYVFTTNCPVELIDPAFRRPGRIDLTLHFPKPDAALRADLVGRWHADIRAAVGVERIVADTAGLSFAEVEELKNLLVLRFLDASEWDWGWAQGQFRDNRDGLADRKADRPFGFTATANGKH